jgi:hypothetical protein
MAFRGVLPEIPDFGNMVARGLGEGFGQGVATTADKLSQSVMENAKLTKQQQVLQDLLQGGNPQGMDAQGTGQRGGGPTRAQIAAYSLMNPAGAKILESQRKEDERQNFAREQSAEPKLQEIGEKLSGLEESGMRFARLGHLFGPELEEKFPPSFSVGMFTKNGELKPTAASLLSPEAQESVKLISDELSGAKDTFGARVTNFDLQSYMKRLPTLLNSAEGRRRVLRDLRLMNQINQMHHQGVLDIVDRYGGPGKISLSKAEMIYKKEFAPKIKDLREEFINPEKKNFSDLPDPSIYNGRQAIDEETGQKFKSNGKEWIPE